TWTVPGRGMVVLLACALVAALGVAPALSPGRAAQDPKDRQIEELKKEVDQLRREKQKANPRKVPLPADWVRSLHWRSIGPAGMGGRITSISVFEADPSTYWVATAGGGLLKTENHGITFTHQFDREATVSIGDVCVAPSDKDIVYAGTGEANPRNSVSYG